MNELLLCLAAVCMVVWILLLMHENRGLKDDLGRAKRQLQEELDRSAMRLEIRNARKLTSAEVNRISNTSKDGRR